MTSLILSENRVLMEDTTSPFAERLKTRLPGPGAAKSRKLVGKLKW